MTSTSTLTFRCFVFGEGASAMQGVELLRDRGHTICGVFTADDSLRAWSVGQGIAVPLPGMPPATFLSTTPFDYLFSIANPVRLPEEVLRLPGRGAINFHDAPLPRYAGLNALSWAILNREETYAVTWHAMEAGLDTGAILNQTAVVITPLDTSLTLGIKCAEACMKGFRALLASLEAGLVTATPQDLSARTYFSRSKRPEAACLLLWDRPAEELSALVRALDFGPATNRLGLPKVLVGGACFTVTTLAVADGPAGAEPGTVLAVGAETLIVATATRPVVVGGWATMESASPLRPADCVHRFGLKVGSRLEVPAAARRHLLSRADAAVAGQEEFWSGVLAAALPVALPGVLTRRSGPRRVARRTWSVPEATLAALAAAGLPGPRSHWIVAAWGAFLGRMSGLEAFDLAVPVQDVAIPWDTVGEVFAAQVPLRFEMDDETTLRGLLQTLCDRFEGLRQHLTWPKDLVARRPNLRASAARWNGLAFPVGAAIVGDVGDGARAMDGDALLLVAEGALELALLYDQDVLGPEELVRLQDCFQAFWSSLAAGPDRPLSRHSLLASAERRRILQEGKATRVDVPSDLLVHRLFEAQVARSPEAVALRQGSRTLTYRELNQYANRLARRLRMHGVGTDVLVGLSLRRSCEMVVGMLAVMKAGGAYVPLDPDAPEKRTSLLLELSGALVVVTTPGTFASTGSPARAVVAVPLAAAGTEGEGEDEDGANLILETGARDLAYVIHTSGSSGTPKGVMIEHRSLVNFVLAAVERYALGPAERALQFASFAFDASVEEIFPALVAGATLVLRTDATVSSADRFHQDCAAWSITRLFLPTSYWHHLCAQMDAEGWRLPETVNLVVIGGERALPGALAVWQRHVGRHVRLLNTYGPTETTVVATWCELAGHGQDPAAPLPIGRPLPNVQARVLDRHLQPVPVGVAGELYLGGPGLARGYLGQPELTAASFVHNPHDDGNEPRLYRTGDKVRLRADGLIAYLGRLDDQLKIRGFRIEPGEVEGALRQAPDVLDCVVVARDFVAGDLRLVAYLVTRTGRAPGATALRAFLRARLPGYMVPAVFMQLPKLPVDTNGKVDRRGLPSPEFGRAQPGLACELPGTPAEESLARIFAEVLKITQVGIHDNFLDLGGDSLLAFKFIALLRERTRVELPLRLLFESPTPAALAERLIFTEETSGPGDDAAVGVGRFALRPTVRTAAPSDPTAIDDLPGKQLA